MSIIFKTTDKYKYCGTKAECKVHQFDEFDIAKLCYSDKLNEHQVLGKAQYADNKGRYVGFIIYHPKKDFVLSFGTLGDYFIQFKDKLSTIVSVNDFKKMHKNDFIELYNKLKESLHE